MGKKSLYKLVFLKIVSLHIWPGNCYNSTSKQAKHLVTIIFWRQVQFWAELGKESHYELEYT